MKAFTKEEADELERSTKRKKSIIYRIKKIFKRDKNDILGIYRESGYIALDRKRMKNIWKKLNDGGEMKAFTKEEINEMEKNVLKKKMKREVGEKSWKKRTSKSLNKIKWNRQKRILDGFIKIIPSMLFYKTINNGFIYSHIGIQIEKEMVIYKYNHVRKKVIGFV